MLLDKASWVMTQTFLTAVYYFASAAMRQWARQLVVSCAKAVATERGRITSVRR